jgi:ankyrin repeat protein
MAYLHSSLLPSQTSKSIFLDFFFFGRGEALQKSPLGMFRSLLYQLYRTSSIAKERIYEAYEEKRRGFGDQWKWQVVELEKLLKDVVKKVARKKEVTIFVDALDEAVDENGEKAAPGLLQFFHELNDSAVPEEGCLGGVKICVSCRHYPIVGSFGPGAVIQVEKENARDVWNFIHDKLQGSVPGWDGESLDARQGLVDGIARKADGVFQWASLRLPKIVRSLNDGDASIDEINEMIEGESNELFPLYESIFGNDIPVWLRKRALLFLQWMCFAERPMSLAELRFAMACDDDDVPWPRRCCEESEYFVKSDAQMEKLTKSLSGGLVEVRRHDTGTKIQFIHETVNEFLHSQGLQFLVSRVATSPAIYEGKIIGQSQTRLTRSCLNFLRMEYVLEETEQWLDGDENLPPFLGYATKYWFLHAKEAEKNEVPQQNIVNIFRSAPGTFETWVKGFTKIDYSHQDCPANDSSLIHVASSLNLKSVVQALLRSGVPVGARDARGMTALHLAAFHGNYDLAVLLLDSHAEIDAKCKNQSTPLERAAANGHESIAKLFLEKGADIDEKGSFSGCALQVAAAKGSTSLVRFLLENGADVNARSRDPRSGLQIAAGNGHEAVVRLLVAKGADLSITPDGYYTSGGNALHIAASMGYEEVCRVLLDEGADIHAETGEYGYALHAAVRNPNWSSLVRLLLERNANVHAAGGTYCTALQSAASRPDNEEIIRLLLDRGADVNLQGGLHGSAFLAATYSGSEGNIRLLIAHGACTDVEGGNYGNALQAAVVSGNSCLVKYFLDKGANVNKKGGEHGTALHAATRGGEAIVDLLLEKRADVNACGPEFGIVLNAAVHWRRESIVRKLLAGGAKISCDGTYLCALERAARRGDVNMLKILLDHGANINCHGGGRRAGALQNAASWGHKLAVELLLERGADINVQTSKYGTPLQMAILAGQKPVVELLLDRGADLNECSVFSMALEVAKGNKTITKLLLERGAKQVPDGEADNPDFRSE